VSGIVGFLCCLGALVAVMIPHSPGEVPIPRSPLEWRVLENGLLGLGLGVVGAIVLAAMLMRYFQQIPLANKLLLPEAATGGGVPAAEGSPIHRIREGDLGEVTGMCRPVGVVRFGSDLFDAMTEGEPLDPGTKVRVIRHEGNRLVVEKV
ncbi:MAG: NfeD family protein, partial [Planctomycetota bacterium]|nr:NfeD family protein [Planctomycetota bacterium]